MSAIGDIAWPERNQRYLARCFAELRQRIERHDPASEASTAAPADGPPDSEADDDFQPAGARIARLFGLSPFEYRLLLLCAGIELDDALRESVARAQGASAAQGLRVSYALALAVLDAPHWDALSPCAPLRRWSLVSFDTTAGHAGATLRIDEHVLHHLTGVASQDTRLAGYARLQPDAPAEDSHTFAKEVAVATESSRRPLVMLANAITDAMLRREGREAVAAIHAQLGLRTLWIDASAVAAALGAEARELDLLARHLDRECALEHAGVALELPPEQHHQKNLARMVAAMSAPVIVLGCFSADDLADADARDVLRFNLPQAPAFPARAPTPALARAAQRSLQQFRVAPALLDQAMNALRAIDGEAAIEDALWDRLREAARGGLDALAHRIDSRASFDDLVVPAFVLSQLREIASQLRHRHQVYDEWGFGLTHERGRGIAALFAGESGTGKTLAAEAIANEARLDLYRIDLASVVSKYIGETEKNLSRLFDAAEASGAVLLFDEADALFGKRSEVKDSHDRYANIEVAYLLQRIESYRGLAILTSNMKSALDRSFLRRIRFVVQFPFPDPAARAEIWRRQFPPAAPRADDVDFAALSKLQLAGGNIRAVVLNAAFKAAARNDRIGQALLVEAAHAEHAKLDRSMSNVSVAA